MASSSGVNEAESNILHEEVEFNIDDEVIPNSDVDIRGLEGERVQSNAELGGRARLSRDARTGQFVEWRTQQLERNFRNALSAWRKNALKTEQLLSLPFNLEASRQRLDGLVSHMGDLQEAHERYLSLSEKVKKFELSELYYSAESDNHKLVKRLSEIMRENAIESQSLKSVESHKSRTSSRSRSSKHSNLSTSSKRLEAALDAAALKAKLKGMELVKAKRIEFERMRSELDKAKVCEKLSIAEAKLNAIAKENNTIFDSVSQLLPEEVLTSAENVQQYLKAESRSPALSNIATVPDQLNRDGINDTHASCLEDNSTRNILSAYPRIARNESYPNVHADEFYPLRVDPCKTIRRGNSNADSEFVMQNKVHKQVNDVPHAPFPDNSNDNLCDLLSTLAQQVSIGRLPTPEPNIFSGDPLAYPTWKSSFDILIGHKGIPAVEKIFYLKKYLGGEAREAVEGYFLLSSDDAYLHAMSLLESRYGSPFVIANAFRDKLESWPKIPNRDGQSLRKFADFLQQCSAAMVSIGSLHCLNDERENRKLLKKLPEWLGWQWGRKVAECRQLTGEFPPFNEFVSLIVREANIACDPVTSLNVIESKSYPSDRQYKPRKFEQYSSNAGVSSFATDTNEFNSNKNNQTSPTCEFCNRSHHIDLCKLFLKKQVRERKQFVREKGLCFACLSKGHRSRWCRQRKVCSICSFKHPTSLHGDRRETEKDDVGKECKDKSDEATAVFATKSHAGETSSFSCKSSMTLPVFISHRNHPDRELLVYALLDTQSDTTFISDDLRVTLEVDNTPVKLRLSTMSSQHELIDSSKVNGLTVRGYDSDISITLPPTYTRDIIPANRSHIPTPEMAQKWPHLSKIVPKLKPLMDVPVSLLIGYNCSQALVPRDVIPPVNNGPYAQRTDLGWGIVGIVGNGDYDINQTESVGWSHHILNSRVASLSLQDTADDHGSSIVVLRTSVKEVINPKDVTCMMELDFNESKSKQAVLSQEDRKFVSKVSAGIHIRSDGRYEMPLPFRQDDLRLPDNKQMAFHRLMLLKRRLKANPNYRHDYINFMQDVIASGYAEQVPDAQNHGEVGKVWYIPHHGVYHPKRPSKIRVVFDCSAKFGNISLNDCLLQGPDFTNRLHGVLCRFRLEPIAFMCDIKKMFYQFKVSPEHRDFLRFLWWVEGDYETSPVEYRMTVHLFGAVSSPSCANFGLKRTADDNEGKFSKAADFLRRDFYVDDGLKCTKSVKEAVQLIQDSKSLCSLAGLALHKFVSNSKAVLSEIPHHDCANAGKVVDLVENISVERALGVEWCLESDEFQFRIVLIDTPLTRRGILSTVSSVYDPLGFVAPVVLKGKQILQQMCVDKCDWDDPVPEKLRPLWEEWRNGLDHLRELRVKRCFKPKCFGKVKLAEFHHFSDASTTGYGQCSYLRLVDEHKNVHCSLVMGKSRVTPLKPITVPRLELTAALVSVKVSSIITEELLESSEDLANASEIFWSDSKVVLGYIANETRRFHVFVANRVQQIRENTTPSQWKYISTDINPADDASRGITAENLVHRAKWITGPDFLWDADLQLSIEEHDPGISDTDPEVKSSFVVATEPVADGFELSRLNYFSNWNRMVRAVANCLRYVRLLKKMVLEKRTKYNTRAVSKNKLKIEPLSVNLLNTAQCLIVRRVQLEAFSEEIVALSGGQGSRSAPVDQSGRVLGKCSSVCKLDPFIDENGLLRVGGRLRQGGLSFEVTHPIILPRKSHVTEVFVRHCHGDIEHQGRGMTTNRLRSCGFWILGCSSVVKSVIHRCVDCRKRRRQTENQKMSDLPPDRVEPAPPFTYCAVDIFGPWTIKEGRKELKRYGVLFTCMASRAIHVETANTLSTDSFINALRRLIAIRGPIRQLRSDRGTNFIGAEHELRAAFCEMDQRKVHAFLAKERCDYVEFKTNVPSASHMGGVWERQIRSVRSVLTSLLGTAGTQLDDESLRTFMHEAASIVNSRPLTVGNLNDPMSCEPLTPNHILTMKSGVVLPPPGNFQREDLYCRKRWRRVQHLANEFWYRWKREYLQSIQVRSKWNKVHRDLKVGDIVLIRDENLSRGFWPLAVVEKVFPSEDTRVRKVRLAVGDPLLDDRGRRVRPPSYLDRPVQKLVLVLPKDDNASCA